MGCCGSKKGDELKRLDPSIVHLFVFPRTKDQVHVSVPCHKVEAYLRIKKIPYILHTTLDFSLSPNERLPFAVLPSSSAATVTPANNSVSAAAQSTSTTSSSTAEMLLAEGTAARGATAAISTSIASPLVIAESEAIIDALEKLYPDKSDQPHLTSPVQRATARLLQTAWEYMRLHVLRHQLVDHLSFSVGVGKDYAPKFIPDSHRIAIMSVALSSQFRAPAIQALNTVGQGDLSHERYHNDLVRDLQAIQQLIESNSSDSSGSSSDNYDKSNIGFVVTSSSQGPTRYDVLCFAHMWTIMLGAQYSLQDDCPALRMLLEESGTLNKYMKRMRALVWGADGKLERELQANGDRKIEAGIKEWTEEYLFRE